MILIVDQHMLIREVIIFWWCNFKNRELAILVQYFSSVVVWYKIKLKLNKTLWHRTFTHKLEVLID